MGAIKSERRVRTASGSDRIMEAVSLIPTALVDPVATARGSDTQRLEGSSA
jgi:hypothetical protein